VKEIIHFIEHLDVPSFMQGVLQEIFKASSFSENQDPNSQNLDDLISITAAIRIYSSLF